ncbi:MAG: cysteine desulfurase [Ruminococcaceae bacterium]|nr:cysteine desulfurase [Oscillospiraceae bacterium]
MIYADYAATHPLRAVAREAMTASLDLWGNPSSLHAAGRNAREALEGARATVARLIGASPSEIVFTSGGSESNTAAIRSAALHGAREGKRHILSTVIEHPSVLNTLHALSVEGFEVALLPVTSDGYINAPQVAAAIRPDTALVTVMHANNEIGTVQPIREIAAVCRRRGVPFHTDAVQTVGHISVNATELGVDTLSFSGHKFGGPHGIGVLYVRKGAPFTPLIPGGHQEAGRRAGTENLLCAVGLAAALEEAVNTMDGTGVLLRSLSNALAGNLLNAIPSIRLNGCPRCMSPYCDSPCSLPHIVSLTFDGIDGEALVYRLDTEGIAVSAGSACTAGSPDPSHVITALGLDPETALGTIRISLGADNTDEDIARMTEAIVRLVTDLQAF